MKLMRKGTVHPAISLVLGMALVLGLAVYGSGSDWRGVTRYLPDSEAAALIGGLSPGACGVLVGLGVAVVALGSSTITVGLGAAFAISAGIHISAALCLD